MPNSESVLENETHKLLKDFEIQIDHLISTRRPDLVIVNKKKRRIYRIVNHRVKLKESEMRDKYLDLVRELKNNMINESDDYTNCNWRVRYNHQMIGTRTGGLENKRTNGDHSNHSIIKIG